MVVQVRCFQCKEKISGRGTGQQHADATGHTWQPGYYCTDCEQTFPNYSKCKKHVKDAGAHSKTVPTKSPTVSESAPATPSSFKFKLSASATPFSLSTPGTYSSWSASDIRGIAAPREVSPGGVPELVGTPCTICNLTFPSKESLEEHFVRTSTCRKCSLHLYAFQKLKKHRCVDATPETVAASSAASETGSDVANGSSSGVQCLICKLTFKSTEILEEHAAHTFTCTKCCIHFYASEVLQDHYRTSAMHPTCRECGAGFPGVAEWATHRARCPPPKLPPELAEPGPGPTAAQSTSTSTSMSTASASRAVPGVFPSAPPPQAPSGWQAAEDGDGDAVSSYYGTAREPSEVSSEPITPSSPPFRVDPAVVGRLQDDLHDFLSNSAVSRDTVRTPFAESFEDLSARALQDGLMPPKVDKGKGKGLSTNEALRAIPHTATTTLEDSRRTGTGTRTAAPKPQSFHCRSCLADPCVKPVATLCGHIFCHSCIVRELAAKTCCPVCQRLFFVRLRVGARVGS